MFTVSETSGHESGCQDSSFVSLSFRDLPVAVQVASGVQHESSDAAFFNDPSFEFFSRNLSATADEDPPEFCPADEVFLRGKLLPLKPPPPPSSFSPTKALPFFNRRSSSECRYGVDCLKSQKLRRTSSESDPMAPLSPQPAAARRLRPGSPRWYLFAFGSVRVPMAMEMRDIRSRQRMRRASPPARGGGGEWFCDGKKAWKFLRSLSCRRFDTSDVAKAAASASSGFFSQFSCL